MVLMVNFALWHRVDASPVCAFRAAFGTLMVVHAWRLYALGMYERSVVMPKLHFSYSVFGFELRPVLPWSRPTTMVEGHCHLLLIASSALGVACGIRTRSCALVFALSYASFVVCERTMFNNHYYLYVLLALLFALVDVQRRPTEATGRLGSGRLQPAGHATVAAWERDILRLQVCIVYAYAGLAKCNEDWVMHSQGMATKLPDEAAMYNPILAPLLVRPEVARLVSLAGVAFDLLAAPLLTHRATRPFGIIVASAFHLSNHLIWSIGEFPWVMLATNLLFFDSIALPALTWILRTNTYARQISPPDPVSSTPAVSQRRGVGPDAAQSTLGRPSVRARAALAAGAVHAAVQLLLPLRPLLISRFDALDVLHTKTHSLLSWRMMAATTRNFINVSLRSDALGATLQITRTYNKLYIRHANGSSHQLAITPVLEPRQAGYMPYTPSMLLQFARYAAKAHSCSTADGCRIVGNLWSSINGRPLQRFVSPSVDLARAVLDERHRPDWVNPLLREFGNSTWRRRMAWLRRHAGTNRVAFFADSAGGVFSETFPDVGTFPLRIQLVPLHGLLAVDSAEGTRILEAPRWLADAHGDGCDGMMPTSAPAPIPFAVPHAVRTLGSSASCWAYVFDEHRGGTALDADEAYEDDSILRAEEDSVAAAGSVATHQMDSCEDEVACR